MAKLVDLKMSKREAEEQLSSGDMEERDRYPWGLSISLDADTYKKLGSPSMDAGGTVEFMAQAKVTSVNVRETDKGTDTTVSLQITHMAIEEPKEETTDSDRAKAIFDKA